MDNKASVFLFLDTQIFPEKMSAGGGEKKNKKSNFAKFVWDVPTTAKVQPKPYDMFFAIGLHFDLWGSYDARAGKRHSLSPNTRLQHVEEPV